MDLSIFIYKMGAGRDALEALGKHSLLHLILSKVPWSRCCCPLLHLKKTKLSFLNKAVYLSSHSGWTATWRPKYTFFTSKSCALFPGTKTKPRKDCHWRIWKPRPLMPDFITIQLYCPNPTYLDTLAPEFLGIYVCRSVLRELLINSFKIQMLYFKGKQSQVDFKVRVPSPLLHSQLCVLEVKFSQW